MLQFVTGTIYGLLDTYVMYPPKLVITGMNPIKSLEFIYDLTDPYAKLLSELCNSN